MNKLDADEFTGANAGGPRQLLMQTLRVARIVQLPG